MISLGDMSVRGHLVAGRIKQDGSNGSAEWDGEHGVVLPGQMCRRVRCGSEGNSATQLGNANRHQWSWRTPHFYRSP